MLLDGKLACITGAARGIGAAMARCFAAQGAQLLLADRDEVALWNLTQGLRADGIDAQVEVVDVTDPVAIGTLANAADRYRDGLHVLVNNAGIAHRSNIGDADALIQWERVLAVNLGSVYAVTRALLVPLRRARGCVINLSSIVAYGAGISSPAYVSSKGAVRSLTQALARDLGPDGIRVNALAPGLIDTDMTSGQREAPGGTDWYRGRSPMGRLGQPGEVAQAALFLASPMASYINGVVLPVDGGYLAV